jgi:DNA-binding transcriptional LysR family regulator
MPDSADGFDWTLVRSFLAVLDAGSLTGAARQTGALQSTLSRHISDLEAQLRAPLFERTGRGVSPTAAGLAIADAARRMREQAQALGAALSAERTDLAGTVRVSASQVTAQLFATTGAGGAAPGRAGDPDRAGGFQPTQQPAAA